MSRKRKQKIPCINDAFQMHLRVNLCKTCIDFKRERDFYKERCRIYERQIEKLYKLLQSESPNNIQDVGTSYAVDTFAVTEQRYSVEGPSQIAEEESNSEEVEQEGVSLPSIDIYGPLSLVKVKLEEIEPGNSSDVPGSSSDANLVSEPGIPSEDDEPLEHYYNPNGYRGPKSHTNLLKCLWKVNGAKTCNKVFRSSSDIKRHIRNYHVIGPCFSQHFCLWKGCSRKNRVFNRKRFILAHVDRMHVGDQRWHCRFLGCSKSFYLKFDWKKHELTHTKLRYPCTYQGCSKWFGFRPDLKRHELTHTGLKYSCVIPGCGMMLSQSCDMFNHIDTCHPGTVIQKCIVASCGEEVLGPDDLSAHLQSHENLETFPCGFPGCDEECGDLAVRDAHRATHVDGNRKELLETRVHIPDLVSVVVQEPEEITEPDSDLEQKFGTHKYGQEKSS